MSAASPSASAATRTAFLQYAARSVGLLAAIFSTALIARELGNDYVDWGSILVAVSLMGVLLDPGLSPVIVRRLAVDHAAAPTPEAMLPLRLVLGVVSLATVVLLAVLTRGTDTLWLALALGAQVLPRSIAYNAVPWLQVDQRLFRFAVAEAATGIVGLIAIAASLAAGLPVATVGLLGFTLPATVLAIVVWRELTLTPSAKLRSPGLQAPKIWSVLRETAPLAAAVMLTAIYTRTSIAFVNSYESDARASEFFFAFLFAEQSIAIAGIAAGAVLPLLAARTRIAHLISDDITHRLLIAITAVGTLLCASLIAASHLLTTVIGGPVLAGGDQFVQLIAPTAAVIMPAMVLAYVYVSIGRGRRYLAFAGIGLMGNVLLNLAFAPTYGAVAAARITWATELLVMAIPLVEVVRSGAGGRRAGVAMLVLVGAAITGSELAAAGLNGWMAGALVVVACLLVAHGPIRWLAREMFRRT